MIIGFIVFLFYIYFFVGFDQVLQVVQSVDLTGYVTFYSLAIVTMMVVMLCWVISWQALLKALGVKIKLKKAFLYYWIGDFVDLIIPCPAVCGDATRLFFVNNETQGNYGTIAAAGVTNRIVAYSVVMSGLSLGTIYILTRPAPVFVLGFLVAAWLGAAAWLGLLLYLVLREEAPKKLAAILMGFLRVVRMRRYCEALSPKVLDTLLNFHEGFHFFRAHPRFLIKPIIFQTFSFTLNMVVYVFVFYSLGFSFMPFDFFMVVYFLGGAVQDATAAFSIGGLEILLINIFVFYGIAPAASGVSAVVLRIVTFWFPLIVGYILTQAVGAKRLLNAKNKNATSDDKALAKS